MVAGENRVAPELNEKEAIELLEDLSNVLGAFLVKQSFHKIPVYIRLLSQYRHINSFSQLLDIFVAFILAQLHLICECRYSQFRTHLKSATTFTECRMF